MISDLIRDPYHIAWGSSIKAKISALNLIGSSLVSDVGNGAIILTNPDRPISLANVPAVTTSSQVGLTWSEGVENGGSTVIDY